MAQSNQGFILFLLQWDEVTLNITLYLGLELEFKPFHRELPLACKVMFKCLSVQYKESTCTHSRFRNLPPAVFTVYIPDTRPFRRLLLSFAKVLSWTPGIPCSLTCLVFAHTPCFGMSFPSFSQVTLTFISICSSKYRLFWKVFPSLQSSWSHCPLSRFVYSICLFRLILVLSYLPTVPSLLIRLNLED